LKLEREGGILKSTLSNVDPQISTEILEIAEPNPNSNADNDYYRNLVSSNDAVINKINRNKDNKNKINNNNNNNTTNNNNINENKINSDPNTAHAHDIKSMSSIRVLELRRKTLRSEY
jgi:hypothetical protein